jgi:hypothetical protein
MKQIMVVLSLLVFTLMFSLTTQAGTFKDNFDDGNFDGWKILDFCNDRPEWKVEKGILTGKHQGACSASLIFGENGWRNYSIECDAKMVESFPVNHISAIGLDLRVPVPNPGSVVGLYVTPGKAVIETWINLQLASSSAIKPFDLQLNQWYRLKGVVSGDNFEFYIDGKLMASLSEARLATGYVGVEVQEWFSRKVCEKRL